jgi:hypothetical protein
LMTSLWMGLAAMSACALTLASAGAYWIRKERQDARSRTVATVPDAQESFSFKDQELAAAGHSRYVGPR